MTSRFLLSCTAALSLLASTAAQNEEVEFKQRQAKTLNGFAKKVFDKGFPRLARIVWMYVHKYYDQENAEAWTAMGYYKDGTLWKPDPKRPYPKVDKGSGADGPALQKQWEAVMKDLANQHRQMAEKYATAGDKARADQHWSMVLRWVDKDEQAQQALGHTAFEGVSGTTLEQSLFDRSKKIERAIEEQSQVQYEVKQITAECPPLDRAKAKYISVQSEHFTLHGDPDQLDNLMNALRWAERTLQVCKVAFPWQYADSKWPQDWACVNMKETYHDILRANEVPDLAWKLEHGASDVIGTTEVTHTNGVQVLNDSCVRNVVQVYAGFGVTGFAEGIGHTFVGQIFQNNRLFSIDRKRQEGTAASEEDLEFKSPDFEVWKELNLELASRSKDLVPANRLPFCEPHDFPNEERIKAWSFCDYMMRRDPEMLRAMDQIAQEMKKERKKQPDEFERRFDEKYKDHSPPVTFKDLDKEWSDFWTGASPVMRSILNNTPPLTAVSKGVDKWLEGFNAARKGHGRAAVNWSASFSTRCKDHAEYLKQNKDLRRPADLHTQVVAKGGSYSGSLFAQMALVQTGASVGNAKKIFERWLYWPGYRDALLNNTILTVGMYQEGDILVVNATSGIGVPKASDSGADCFPPRNDTNLIFDGEVQVADLGPEVEALLDKEGRKGQKTIGFPLTLHFGNTGGIGVRGSLKCVVTGPKGDEIKGVIAYDEGTVRTTTAPGMVTFWPLDPLKGKVNFQWSWMADDKQMSLKGAFSAK